MTLSPRCENSLNREMVVDMKKIITDITMIVILLVVCISIVMFVGYLVMLSLIYTVICDIGELINKWWLR